MRTVEWDYNLGGLRLIDQRLLPGEFKVNSYQDYHQVVAAIRDMVVRGAPAIGATAAFGMALAAHQSKARSLPALRKDLQVAEQEFRQSRPTARNLVWALERVMRVANTGEQNANKLRIAILSEAQQLADEDVQINQTMARFGAELDRRWGYDHPPLQYRRAGSSGLGYRPGCHSDSF